MQTFARVIPADQWSVIESGSDAYGVSPSICFYAMLAEVWAMYHTSRHFTMAMMYTRRLPLHPAVEALRGNFYTVVPLEVNLLEGRTFDALLKDVQAQTLDIHRNRWSSGIDAMQQLSAVFKRVGRAVVPFVISSAIGRGANTSISSSSFGSGVVRGTYAPPQVLVDVSLSQTRTHARL